MRESLPGLRFYVNAAVVATRGARGWYSEKTMTPEEAASELHSHAPWLTTLSGGVGIDPGTLSKVISSIVALLLVWLCRAMLLRFVFGRVSDQGSRYRWRKNSATLAFLVALVIVARVWFEGLASLTTYLGLLSAGLAIALKDPLTDIAGWLFIVWRRPFAVGDRIQVGAVAGDVIDIRLFQFSLLEIGEWVHADQSTGRIVHVPNSTIFTQHQANYSQGFEYIWNEVPVLVTFESDWKKAKEILKVIADRHGTPDGEEAAEQVARAARTFLIFYDTLTPIVYTAVRDSGVELTIRHLCNPRRRRTVTEAIWEEILEEFSRCPDIDFAYPTQRWYDGVKEGAAPAAQHDGAGGGRER
jgi:small-conductance mechanosensitive channel